MTSQKPSGTPSSGTPSSGMQPAGAKGAGGGKGVEVDLDLGQIGLGAEAEKRIEATLRSAIEKELESQPQTELRPDHTKVSGEFSKF